MKKMTSLFALVLILLMATFLRFHLLDGQSFWNDEGNSARLSERSIELIIEGTASDIHPPLYYVGLHGWRKLVGDSEFGLRSFSAFAGVLLVAVGFGLSKIFQKQSASLYNDNQSKVVIQSGTKNLLLGREGRFFRKKRFRMTQSVVTAPIVTAPIVTAPIVTAVIIAINPALIYYSQEARMYALLGLLALLTTWLMLHWWRRPSFLTALAYIVFAAAGLYTHYFFPVVLVVHNLFVVICHLSFATRNHRRVIVDWVGMMVATFLIYLPWLPIFLQQLGSGGVERPFLPDFLRATWRWMLFGETIEETAVNFALIILVLLSLWGVVRMEKRSILPLLGILTPLVFMMFTGTTGPEFFKFLVVAVPFVAILLTMGAENVLLNKGGWGRWVGLLPLLILLPGTVQSINNMAHNLAYARADYRGMAARIEAEAHPNAGVILDAPNQWEVFTYYYPDEFIYPLPKGLSLPNPAEIDATLTEIAAKHDRLYAIFWGEAQRDPQRLVESWLDQHAFKATDEWVGDVRFVTYAIPDGAATEMETAVSISFGDNIQLNGFTLRADDLRGGDIVQVTLFWETAVSLPQRYKIFLHLIDENGQVVAQRDSEPSGGLSLTTHWQPDEIIVDNHGILIPAQLSKGNYSLLLGMYNIDDPTQRLTIQMGAEEVDAWKLAQILVSE